MQFNTIEETMKNQRIKSQTSQRLISLVRKQGFQMIEPDYFEDYDRFTHAHQRVTKQRIVKLMNPLGEVLVLRPDVTTSIASKIVPLLKTEEELKLFYYATTFNVGTQGKIESRKQFGIEWFNAPNTAEKAVLALIVSIVESLNLPYIIELGSEEFLNTLIRQLELPKADETHLKTMIAYKDSSGLNTWLKTQSLPNTIREVLEKLFSFRGCFNDLAKLIDSQTFPEALSQSLTELYQTMASFQDQPLRFDLSMISEFEYYTGVRFKVYIENVPKTVLKGGRYLAVNPYGHEEVSAIGFTMESDALLKELIKNG